MDSSKFLFPGTPNETMFAEVRFGPMVKLPEPIYSFEETSDYYEGVFWEYPKPAEITLTF